MKCILWLRGEIIQSPVLAAVFVFFVISSFFAVFSHFKVVVVSRNLALYIKPPYQNSPLVVPENVIVSATVSGIKNDNNNVSSAKGPYDNWVNRDGCFFVDSGLLLSGNVEVKKYPGVSFISSSDERPSWAHFRFHNSEEGRFEFWTLYSSAGIRPVTIGINRRIFKNELNRTTCAPGRYTPSFDTDAAHWVFVGIARLKKGHNDIYVWAEGALPNIIRFCFRKPESPGPPAAWNNFYSAMARGMLPGDAL